jgi:Putative auto-transporter adhesin, head GIN domain
MKQFLFAVAILLCGYSVMAQKINDPNAVVREAKNFHGISVGHAFDVYLNQSNEEAVAVSATSDKDRAHIIVDVKDGILYIGLDKGWKWNGGDKKLKAYISFKKIDKLVISGACDVVVAGAIKADNLSIRQSGASDFNGKIEVDKLTVDLSGASDMVISGKASSLHVDASGASKFKGYELTTENCNVDASGASDIKVTVSKELSAEASGASDVRYKGEAVIRDLKSSGSSSVKRG